MQLDDLIAGIRNTRVQDLDISRYNFNPTAPGDSRGADSADVGSGDSTLYHNEDISLGIHFQVTRLPFTQLQVMDPRLVRIAPGASNEKHRHAHESIFVVISGCGEISIGPARSRLEPGQVTYVPRWVVHQTHNLSSEAELVVLAITDFGLTSAVLGDYDSTTRLRSSISANAALAATKSEA